MDQVHTEDQDRTEEDEVKRLKRQLAEKEKENALLREKIQSCQAPCPLTHTTPTPTHTGDFMQLWCVWGLQVLHRL